MKLLIVADIEGVAGVVTRQQCIPGNSEYQNARQLMAEEVNAVVRGATAAGATDIVVVDSHGSMTNIQPDMLESNARLVSGKPRQFGMIDGIQFASFDAVMMVGAHCSAGNYGVLAHTINSRAFLKIEVNGQVMGEVDLYGGVAAEHGVPMVLVSGDHLLKEHVGDAFPDSHFVTVKQARGQFSAESLSPEQARNELFTAARDVIDCRIPSHAPYQLQAPYTLTVSSVTQGQSDTFALVPGVERTSPNQVSWQGESFIEMVKLLNSLSAMSSSLGACTNLV